MKDIILAIIATPAALKLLSDIFNWVATTFFDKEKKATLEDVMTAIDKVQKDTDVNTANIQKLSDKLEIVESKTEEDKALTARRRILRFNDEVRNNESEIPCHSLEHWQEIMRDIDFYEEYTDLHKDFKNNYAVSSIKNLKSVFEYMQKEHMI